MVTHGGWTAGTRRAPLVVDADQLPPHAATELAALVSDAEAAVRSLRQTPTPAAPDAMGYTLTVDHGDRTSVLKSSDLDTNPQVAALRDWLSKQV